MPVPEVGSAILSAARIPFGGLDPFRSCTFDPPQATQVFRDRVRLSANQSSRMQGEVRYDAVDRTFAVLEADGAWRTAAPDSIDVGWLPTRAVRLSVARGTSVGRVLPSQMRRQSLVAAVFAPDRGIRVVAIAIPSLARAPARPRFLREPPWSSVTPWLRLFRPPHVQLVSPFS